MRSALDYCWICNARVGLDRYLNRSSFSAWPITCATPIPSLDLGSLVLHITLQPIVSVERTRISKNSDDTLPRAGRSGILLYRAPTQPDATPDRYAAILCLGAMVRGFGYLRGHAAYLT